jgi:hypothetical protein
MGRMIAIVLVVVLLSGTFGAAAYASVNGFGLVASGAPFARSGSIGGPVIMGGGPGSGK